MKDADRPLRSVLAFDRVEDEVVVVHQHRNVVIPPVADAVPAVVAEVERDQVEVVGEERPEGVVEIDRETVAVAEDEPQVGVRVAVAPCHGDRLVVEFDFAQ